MLTPVPDLTYYALIEAVKTGHKRTTQENWHAENTRTTSEEAYYNVSSVENM